VSAVHVFGIGSPSGDDQAGWVVIDALQCIGVRAVIEKLDRPGAALVARLQGAPHVILVDAMQSGASPGTVRRFDRGDWSGYRSGLSTHGFGVLAALQLAEALAILPPQLELYGIEIASANPGESVGGAVAESAVTVAGQIAARLRDST